MKQSRQALEALTGGGGAVEQGAFEEWDSMSMASSEGGPRCLPNESHAELIAPTQCGRLQTTGAGSQCQAAGCRSCCLAPKSLACCSTTGVSGHPASDSMLLQLLRSRCTCLDQV